MIIDIPKHIPTNLNFSIADHQDGEPYDSRYYLHHQPRMVHDYKLLVVVVYLSALHEEGGLDSLYGKFDCSIGDHGAGAPVGYTATVDIGKPHSKITIRSRVPDDTPADITWGELLKGCPTSRETKASGKWRKQKDVTTAKVSMPKFLLEKIKQESARYDLDVDRFIIDALAHMLEGL